MTNTLPLQVVHSRPDHTGQTDISKYVSDLEFRSTSPGGYSTASFTYNGPLAGLPIDYTQYSRIDVIDTALGIPAWQGLCEDPGRYAGQDGQSFRMTAVGVSSTLKDIRRPYVGIDASMDSWKQGAPPYILEAASFSQDSDTNVGGPAMLISIPSGTYLGANGGIGYITYLPMLESGQRIGSVQWTDIESGQDGTFVVGSVTQTGTASVRHASGIPGDALILAGVHFGATSWVHLTWERTFGPDVTVGEGCWTRFGSMVVKPVAVDKFGNVITNPPTLWTTWPEIVSDLLGGSGRMSLIDGPSAVLNTNGSDPEHLFHFAFPDGVTAEEILTELLTYEPQYTWLVGVRQSNLKHQFIWIPRPQSVSFDLDLTIDGFDVQASTAELWNSVTVRWRDQLDNIRSQRFAGSPIPALDRLHLTRETILDLGDNTEATGQNVAKAASSFLDEHKFPIRGGTATVSRKLRNHLTGQDVDPWLMDPPFLVRVSGATPAGPADDRDGESVFECVGVTYNANSASATLDLEQAPRTVQGRLQYANPAGRRR